LAKQDKFTERKEQILRAAGHVFAQKGFAGATISDIAREAEVSDATIYEYFTNKEELLFSIPEEATRKGKEAIEFHLQLMRGAENKLRGFIYYQLLFYQDNPDWAAVVMLILKQHRRYTETEAYQVVIRQWARIVPKIVEEGIASGEFKKDTDPYLVRTIVLGTIEHAVISRLLLGRYENLLALVDPLTDLVISGIKKEKKTEEMQFRLIMTPDGAKP